MFVRTLFFLLVFSTMAFAQKPIRYTVENGLPSNHVYKVAQDNEGFVWMLTDKGMTRFDGTHFRTYTTRDGLPLNDIWDIRFTPDGRVWFFTRASKLGYIQDNQVFTFQNADSTESLHPASIFQKGNTISFSGGNGFYQLSEFPTGKNTPKWVRSSPKDIESIKIMERVLKSLNQQTAFYYCGQPNDSMFIALDESKYAVLNLNSNQLISHRYDEFDSSLSKVEATRFINNKESIQIFGQGFSATLDNEGHLTQITKELARYQSNSGFVDKNDNLWMATNAEGVYFVPAATRQSNYPITGKKVSRLNTIQQKIIASVFDNGFYQYDQKKGQFEALIEDKGSIYSAFEIGDHAEFYLTDRKYVKLKDKKKKEYPRSLMKGSIFDVISYKDTLFGLGSMFLAVMDTSNFDWEIQTKSIGLSDFIVYKNKLLFASSNGLMEYKNGQIVTAKMAGQSFDKPSIHLDTCAGQLIICTDGYGAYYTDLEQIDSLPQSDYLSVQSSFSQNQYLWLATNSGVLRYQFKSKRPNFIQKYSRNNGLLSNDVSDVLVMGDSLLVSSDYGVSVLPIDTKNSTSSVLNIYFKSAFYNHEPFEDKNAFRFAKNNQLDIHVGVVDFSMEKNIAFEYRLLPIMTEWQSISSPNLSFSHLSPNSYEIQIKKGELIEKLIFKIHPLWYQTAAAKILFFLFTLAGIIWLGRKYNLSQLQKQETYLSIRRKEIEQELYALRSQMNPHFVFNSLNAIQYYIAKNDVDISEKYLVKFSKLIRMFFSFSRKRTITLKDEIDLLESYLSIEKMRFRDNLVYDFQINPKLDLMTTHIPTMLLQPIIENAVNHGVFHKRGPGHILIQIDKQDVSSVVITITDDGIGWNNAQEVLQNSLAENHLNSTKILLEKIDLLNQSKHWNIQFQVSDNEQSTSGTVVKLIIQQNKKIEQVSPKFDRQKIMTYD